MNTPSLPTTRSLRLAAPLAVAALALTACDVDLSLDDVDGSGDETTETVEVAAFSSIEVSDAFELDVDIDPEAVPTVEVTIDDNLIDRIDVFVRGGVLYIREEAGRDLDPSHAEVHVVARSLDQIVGNGAGLIDVDGLDADEFRLDLQGARLVELDGSVDTLVISAGGATAISAGDLVARDIELDLSGAAGADLHATGQVTGSTQGAVGVVVSGDATVDLDTSGLSFVELD